MGDDDDIPILEDDLDEDVPLLGDDDDIPVLDAPDLGHSANKASLEAALRQLEALELAPNARKKTTPDPAPKPSLEEQIRANAGTPIIHEHELTKIRDNPFLNPQQKAQLDMSRKLRDEAQTMAMITSLNKKKEAPPPPQKAPIDENSIDFTDNTFLKASAAPVSAAAPAKAPAAPIKATEKTDGAADILLELEDDTPASVPTPKKTSPEKLDLDKELAEIDEALSDLGDIIIDEEEVAPAPPPQKTPSPSTAQPPGKVLAAPSRTTDSKQQDKEIHQIIDEIVDEYLIVLEAALRKKLKEKLPDLLKK